MVILSLYIEWSWLFHFPIYYESFWYNLSPLVISVSYVVFFTVVPLRITDDRCRDIRLSVLFLSRCSSIGLPKLFRRQALSAFSWLRVKDHGLTTKASYCRVFRFDEYLTEFYFWKFISSPNTRIIIIVVAVLSVVTCSDYIRYLAFTFLLFLHRYKFINYVYKKERQKKIICLMLRYYKTLIPSLIN